MNDTTNLPATAPATEEKTSTALTVQQRAAVALGSDKARVELRELLKKSADIKEVKNKAGREECHSAYMVLLKARTTIDGLGKAAREDAKNFQKAVIAEAAELAAITEPEELRLKALRDAWDEARAAEKAEAERIERERVSEIHQRIEAIRSFIGLALECRTSGKVNDLLEKLNEGAHCTPGFAEFEEHAMKVLAETKDRLVQIRDAKIEEEAERERVRQEQAAERERLAAERAENERIAAERKAEQDKRDAEAQAQRDADAAELKRQRDALAAENERVNAERAALERKQRLQTMADQKHPNGAPMFSTTTFKDNGDPIMLDPDGKRSVFCDIDDSMDPPAAAPAPAVHGDTSVQNPVANQRPSRKALITLVATTYRVDPEVARNWLATSDFSTVKL